MMQEYVGTRQPVSVTPPWSSQAGADSRTFTPPALLLFVPTHFPTQPREQPKRKHWQTHFSYKSATAVAVLAGEIATKSFAAAMKSLPLQIQNYRPLGLPYRTPHCPNPMPSTPRNPSASLSPQSPAIQHPFDTCVSYDSATTTLQIRHLSDAKRFTPDTRSVECPYLRVDANPPNIPPSKYDEIRQHRSATGICSHETESSATTMRRMRRLPHMKTIAPATKSVSRPIWRVTAPNPESGSVRPNQCYETRSAVQRLSSPPTRSKHFRAMLSHGALADDRESLRW